MAETLAGKVALVTGCGRMQGIGRSVALALARAGADVAVTDLVPERTRNPAETGEAELAAGWKGVDTLVGEVTALGRRAIALTGDVGCESDSARMVAEAISQLGRIDILVNNAGAPHGADRGPTWKVPVAAFDQCRWWQIDVTWGDRSARAGDDSHAIIMRCISRRYP